MTYEFEFTVRLTLECEGKGDASEALEDARFVLEHTLQSGMDSGFYHQHDNYVVSEAEVIQNKQEAYQQRVRELLAERGQLPNVH